MKLYINIMEKSYVEMIIYFRIHFFLWLQISGQPSFCSTLQIHFADEYQQEQILDALLPTTNYLPLIDMKSIT